MVHLDMLGSKSGARTHNTVGHKVLAVSILLQHTQTWQQQCCGAATCVFTVCPGLLRLLNGIKGGWCHQRAVANESDRQIDRCAADVEVRSEHKPSQDGWSKVKVIRHMHTCMHTYIRMHAQSAFSYFSVLVLKWSSEVKMQSANFN